MILHLLAGAALALPAAGAPVDHGKLPWFEGTYEEVLAKASSENKLIFIDFWTSW